MEWKPVKGYEEHYLISSDGKVFSITTNRLLKIYKQKNGYLRIELNANGSAKKHFVHRLVAEAFIPNPNNYPVVNHKDENPSNNNVDNLEWCTYQYNSNYGTIKERISKHRPDLSGANNTQSKKVYQFDLDGNLVAEYASSGEASRITGLSFKSISKACTGALKQYAGFVWSRTNEFKYEARRNYEFKKGNVEMYDLNGNLLKTYTNPIDLEKDGFSVQSVARVCTGTRASYKGYYFKRSQ